MAFKLVMEAETEALARQTRGKTKALRVLTEVRSRCWNALVLPGLLCQCLGLSLRHELERLKVSSAATSRRHCFGHRSHRTFHHSVQLCDRL